MKMGYSSLLNNVQIILPILSTTEMNLVCTYQVVFEAEVVPQY